MPMPPMTHELQEQIAEASVSISLVSPQSVLDHEQTYGVLHATNSLWAVFWLQHQMRAAGIDEEKRMPCTLAHKERMQTETDPWAIAEDVLRRCKMGLPLVPRKTEAN